MFWEAATAYLLQETYVDIVDSDDDGAAVLVLHGPVMQLAEILLPNSGLERSNKGMNFSHTSDVSLTRYEYPNRMNLHQKKTTTTTSTTIKQTKTSKDDRWQAIIQPLGKNSLTAPSACIACRTTGWSVGWLWRITRLVDWLAVVCLVGSLFLSFVD